MSPVAVEVERLAKAYPIMPTQARYRTLRDTITRGTLGWLPGRRLNRRARTSEAADVLWALADVSFRVEEGRAVGIVGRNGAGKTTLLKILARITRPTRGRAAVHGTASALLAVGTGFHPELSGRDNIYLNGAILGMRRQYIREKFDEIVSFAELERFIDMPVKTYSTGMQMRLGFAVAAHLQSDILLVDEVLAVGDATFQKRCLAKMEDIRDRGRTVLFVSHQMAAIKLMCDTAIWLDAGRVRLLGPSATVIAAYLSSTGAASGAERSWMDEVMAPGNDTLRLRAVRVLNDQGLLTSVLDASRPFTIEIEYEVLSRLSSSAIWLTIVTSDGIEVLTSADAAGDAGTGVRGTPGIWVSRCEIMGNLLNDGAYHVSVAADIPFIEWIFREDAVVSFTVEQTGAVTGSIPGHWPGVICPALPWTIDRTSA